MRNLNNEFLGDIFGVLFSFLIFFFNNFIIHLNNKIYNLIINQY